MIIDTREMWWARKSPLLKSAISVGVLAARQKCRKSLAVFGEDLIEVGSSERQIYIRPGRSASPRAGDKRTRSMSIQFG